MSEATYAYFTGRLITGQVTDVMQNVVGIVNGYCLTTVKSLIKVPKAGKRRLIRDKPTEVAPVELKLVMRPDVTSSDVIIADSNRKMAKIASVLRNAAVIAESQNLSSMSLFTNAIKIAACLDVGAVHESDFWKFLRQVGVVGHETPKYPCRSVKSRNHKIVALCMAAAIAESQIV